MFDINFFKKTNNLKNKITNHEYSFEDLTVINNEFEILRKKIPNIYNIETTNYCNMKCIMCPRTLYMTRKNIWIEDKLFDEITDKVQVHKHLDLEDFWDWCEKKYDHSPKEISENGFYLSVVSKSLVLHGFGEPFLDKKLISRLDTCRKKNIPTYFSCTPATMTVEKAKKAMDAGLGVLKFSLDAMDERKIQKIRGKRANFQESVDKILELLKYKKEKKLKTLLVPCMIDMAEEVQDVKMHEEFINFWKDYDVYAYIKSQDNRWLYDSDDNIKKNKSHYHYQYCEYPWISCSIMSEGNVVPCTQISNNEIVLGNLKNNSLEEIWNGEKYQELRKMHLSGNFPKGHKCNEKCDIKKIYQYLKK
jgi:radical SAM protein with 4Fe4S-binding SPASM domain